MTKEKIAELNAKCSTSETGIYVEPYGIPVHIKEPVLYLRYETGGRIGGSCWDQSDPQPYSVSEVPPFEILDIVLKELKPNITYLEYKEVERLIHDNENTEYEYYGNSTDWMVKYIILSELEAFLTTI